MNWNNKTTLHFTNGDLEKVQNIVKYLEKQDFFSNESITKSRVFAIILNAFYELFVESNSRTSYQKRLSNLVEVLPEPFGPATIQSVGFFSFITWIYHLHF